MILPGHLGAGYLAAYYLHLDKRVALAAAIFPDLVDKTARYVLDISPSGRIPMHSLLGWSFSAAWIGLLTRRRRPALAWAAGYATHLLADVLTDLLHAQEGSPYLLWPFVPLAPSRYQSLLDGLLEYGPWTWALEAGVAIWAFLLWLTGRRRRG